jgi:hypothetical protein
MNSPGVQFRKEANYLTLSNALLALRFSLHPSGSLVSLAAKSAALELFDPSRALAESEFWRLEFFAAGSRQTLSSRKALEFSYDFEVENGGAGRLEITWRKFLLEGAELPLKVQITLTLPPQSPLVFARANLQIPPELDLAGMNFFFPHFPGLSLPEPEAPALFLPWQEGLLISAPVAALPQPQTWHYPGELAMQFTGLQFRSRRGCLYLAAQDAAGRVKGVRAGSDGRGEFDLSLLNFPLPVEAGTWEVPYELAFGWLIGDWLEAARHYRSWAIRQSWAPEVVLPVTESGLARRPRETEPRYHGCWLLNRKPSQEALASALALQRVTNGPIRLLWQWWHDCPGDAKYPDYLPPRESAEKLSQTLARFKEAGIRAWMGIDGVAASLRSRSWQSERLADQAALTESGGFWEIEENPFTEENLVAMCPADGQWPARLKAIGDSLGKLGGAGLWLQRLPSARYRCFAEAHPHQAGGGDYRSRELLALVGGAVASEPAELYLRELRASITFGTSLERAGRPAGVAGDSWEPIPLRQAVYAPALSGVGLVGPLANHYPYDPLWSQLPPSPRTQEILLLQGDYSRQFCLEAARSLLWGLQPGLVDYESVLMEDPLSLRKLAFFRTILQVNATETALARGEFLGDIATESEFQEVDFLVNHLYSLPGERRVFSRKVPLVQISAWKGREGRLMLIIVNLSEEESEFSCQLPLYRLGISAPKKVYGLTFSPELGGSQAVLTLSKGRISGRLPGHSASIVWL